MSTDILLLQFANNVAAPLDEEVAIDATAITVALGQGLKFPQPEEGVSGFRATLSLANRPTTEIVTVTARVDDVLTVIRAEEGTTAQIWPLGSIIEVLMTKGVGEEFVQRQQAQAQSYNYAVATAPSANTYVAEYLPNLTAPSPGMPVTFKIPSDNTGAATFNGWGSAVSIRRRDGSALIGGELITGMIAELKWNGAILLLQSVAPASSATASAGTDTQSFVSPEILRTITQDIVRLDDPAFGAVADGIIYPDGSTNWETAYDNSSAIVAAINASVALKRRLYIPPKSTGVWMWKQPLNVVAPQNLFMYGDGEDSNMLYVNPTNKTGLVLGSNTGGVSWVDPTASVLSLPDPISTASTTIRIATSAPGEHPTQRMYRGQILFFVDPSQPIYYRTGANSISQYVAFFATVEEVIDDNYINLGGSPEFSMNPGTKIGYWNVPLSNVHVEHLQFGNDLFESYRSGGSAIIQINGAVNPVVYDTTFSRTTSRGLYITRSYQFDVDLIRGREIAGDSDPFNIHTADGSLMSAGQQSGWGTVQRIRAQGATHGCDFLGDKMTPHLHSRCQSVSGRDSSSTIVGSHTSARFCTFSDIDVACNVVAWNRNGDPYAYLQSDAPIMLRGADCTIINARISGTPIAFRNHCNQGNRFINCKSYNCGRGLQIEDVTDSLVEDMEHVNPVWMGIDLQMSIGPHQGVSLGTNLVFNNIRTTGTPPSLGDVNAVIGGQYPMSQLKSLGWSFQNISRNGSRPTFVGNGSIATVWPNFAASITSNAVDQLVGPGFSIAPTTGAESIAVADTSSVTGSYQPLDIYPLLGGTFTFQTTIRITTVKLTAINVAYAGLSQAPGDVLTLGGGDPITPAQYTVDTVDGLGQILTGHISNQGEYRVTATAFSQASTTGSAITTTVTSVSLLGSSSGRNQVGDILTVGSGSPEFVDGVPQWPHIEVDSIDVDGHILTYHLVSYAGIPAGGAFNELSPSMVLSQLDSTGDGTSSRWAITGFIAQKASFDNGFFVPMTTNVVAAGVYTVAPTGNLATGPSLNGGVGVGALFTAVYGPMIDCSQSPRSRVAVTNTGSVTIESFGPRASVEYEITFAGAKTLKNSSILVLPTGADVVTAAGDSCEAWADTSTPPIYTVFNYSRASGRALVEGGLPVPVITLPTNGTTNPTQLTAAQSGSTILLPSNATEPAIVTLPTEATCTVGTTFFRFYLNSSQGIIIRGDAAKRVLTISASSSQGLQNLQQGGTVTLRLMTTALWGATDALGTWTQVA